MDFTLRTPEDQADPTQAALAPQPAAPAAPPIATPAPPPAAAPLDENTQRRADYAKWLTENKTNAGSPEFVKVAEAYRQLSDAADAPKPNSEAFNVATRFATKAGISPISAVDLGVAATNAGLNPLNWPADLVRKGLEKTGVIAPTEFKPLPEPGAMIRQSLNVPEQASTPLQRGGEFAAEAISGGLPAIARSVIRAAPGLAPKIAAGIRALMTNVVAPTVGAQAGGEIGGQMYGETGRLAGALAGGAGGQYGAGAASRAGRSLVERYDPRQYAGDTAAEVAQQGTNQNVRPTFGALANREGVALERELMPSSNKIQSQSDTMLADMQNRARDLVEQRQALPPLTQGNASIVNIAERERNAGRDASARVQQELQDRVGPYNAVITTPAENAMLALKNKMDASDWNATVKPRLDALRQMQPVDPTTGQPLPYVRYEQFKNWRSNLGVQLADMPGMKSHYVGEVYDPATQAMRDTAIRAGVPGEAFDAAQKITYDQNAAADLGELMRTTLHAEKSGGPRQFADQIEGLTANDNATLNRLGGNNVKDIQELANLARRGDYASVKGGGARILGNVPTRFTPAVLTGAAAHAMGAGPMTSLMIGAGANKMFPSIEGKIIESQWARNRMLTPPPPGPAGPTGPNSFDRVLAAMSAANQGSR